MKYFFDFMILIIYVFGLVGIPVYRIKVAHKDWQLTLLLWTLSCFLLYIFYLDIQQQKIYFLVPAACFGLFAYFYYREKRRLINGLLFNIFLASFMIYITLLGFETKNPLLTFTSVGLGIVLALLLVFGIYALLIFLYWNAIVVLRKEGRSLANLLSLILAVGLTLFLIVNHFSTKVFPDWALPLFSILPISLFYFSVVFYNFLTISVLYQFNRPKYNQDFIIVLGSGLIDGKKVPPLLGNRIQRAIQFYHSQAAKSDQPPKIIMSGGRGDDEHLAESVAMKEYALTYGISETDILVEANSRNTFENMVFSKEIIEETSAKKSYNVIFTTNNFHLFRSGLFAKKAHLKADGLGAKTAFYFLPNAFLREFIAILVINKKRHIIFCGFITLCMIALAVVGFIIEKKLPYI